MDVEESTYYKCGEIYLINKNDNYAFLCYYCDEIFQKFTEFQFHIINCTNILDITDKQIISSDRSIKKSCHNVLQQETKTNISDDFSDLKKENLETKEKENLNEKPKDVNDIATETFCLHCNKFYNCDSHDIKKCAKIQENITKYNGDFLKLLQEGILCCQCKRYFEDYKNLYEHHIEANHCLYNEQCKICKFFAFMNLKVNRNVRRKIKDDSVEKSFEVSCKNCDIIFISKIEYNLHMQIIHKQLEEVQNQTKEEKMSENPPDNHGHTFKCSFCNRLFRTRNQMNTHMRIHTNNRPYKCELCPSAFTVSANLKNHIITKHTHDRPFSCEYEGCKAKFKSMNYKKQHERRHLPGNFQCEKCGNYFINNSSLLKHQISSHEDPKNWPFQCEICQKRFTREIRLIEHKRIHTGEKPFGCDVCQKFFRKRRFLSEHKKIHSDKNNYTCTACGKGFKQSPGYYSHIKSCYKKK